MALDIELNSMEASDQSDQLQRSQLFDLVSSSARNAVPKNGIATPSKITLPSADVMPDETDQETRPRQHKRIKGRRRAINPLAHVESALRRQQELKSTFRALARPLKQVLDEMGRRTTDSLESDPSAHQNAAEFSRVTAGLKAALEHRIAIVREGDKHQRSQMQVRKEAEEETLRRSYQQYARDREDAMIDDIDQELIKLDRRFHHEQSNNNHDTEEEDYILPVPHHVNYRSERQQVLPAEYDSRSRKAIETDKATEQLDVRDRLRDMLLPHMDDVEDDGFTVMDPAPREAADARKKGIEGLNMLAKASQQVESESKKRRRKLPPVLPNKDAASLMALADVATKPQTSSNFNHPSQQKIPPATPARDRYNSDDHNQPLFSSATDQESADRKRRRRSSAVKRSPPFRGPPSSRDGYDRVKIERRPSSPGPHIPVYRRASMSIDKTLDDHPHFDRYQREYFASRGYGADRREYDTAYAQPVDAMMAEEEKRRRESFSRYAPGPHNIDPRLRDNHDPRMRDNIDPPLRDNIDPRSRDNLDPRLREDGGHSYDGRFEYRSQRPTTAEQPPLPPLASPFSHNSSMNRNYGPPLSRKAAIGGFGGSRWSPLGYNPLSMPGSHMPPTAQPIDHFANRGLHRSSLSSDSTSQPLPPPPQPPMQWTSTPSPLVSIPQAMPPVPQSMPQPVQHPAPQPIAQAMPHPAPQPIPQVMPQSMPQSTSQPPRPIAQAAPQPSSQQMPQQNGTQHTRRPEGLPPRSHFTLQVPTFILQSAPHVASPTSATANGPQRPMLAPAPSQAQSSQPVFAQQKERVEQSRRRPLEQNFPKFRPYRGPKEKHTDKDKGKDKDAQKESNKEVAKEVNKEAAKESNHDSAKESR